MITKDINAVIWTGLPCKFQNENFVIPKIEQIINYLSVEIIDDKIRKLAEEYVRKSPKQIDTEYRRAIEKSLHWHPIEYESYLFLSNILLKKINKIHYRIF